MPPKDNQPMNRMNKILLCGLLLCLFGAAGKGYGQEVDIRTDKRYGGLVAAWNFDGDTNEFLSGEKLKVNKGKVAYTMDRNLEEGKALLIQKGQFLSGLNELLPQGGSPRTVMFWMRKTGCGNADITLLHFGDKSKPRGSMNIRLRPCAEWGDYMTTSFVPDLDGNHKYSDALDRNYFDGFWSHITITYSSGIVKAYYNGSAVRNYPPSSSSQKADTASAEVAFGWVMSSDENDDTVICLDDVRVFSNALYSRKIRWVYENEFSEIGESDTDGDGLSDSHEVFLLKTNPDLADTDDDGLSDSDEIRVAVVEGDFNWFEAKADAEKRGGNLAAITSKAENLLIFNFLIKKYLKVPCLWLGGTDEVEEGKWTWVTGEPWDYENWSSGEPNNSNNEDYLQIKEYELDEVFQWNDIMANGGLTSSDTPIGYLIEYSNQYRSDPLDPDSDDDGYTDGEEHEAGTNPVDALDFPQLKSTIQITIADKTTFPFGISFQTNEGSVYEFQASGDLKKWSSLEEVEGTGSQVKVTDWRKAIFQMQYYRIKVLD